MWCTNSAMILASTIGFVSVAAVAGSTFDGALQKGLAPEPWDSGKKEPVLLFEKIPQSVAETIGQAGRKSTLRRRGKSPVKTHYVGRFQALVDDKCNTPPPVLRVSCGIGNSIQLLGVSDDTIVCDSVERDGEWDEMRCANTCVDTADCGNVFRTTFDEEQNDTFGEVYFSCLGANETSARFVFEDSGAGSCGSESDHGKARNYHVAQLGVMCSDVESSGGFLFDSSLFSCSSSASRGDIEGKYSCYFGGNCPHCKNISFDPIVVTTDRQAIEATCANMAGGGGSFPSVTGQPAASSSRVLTGVATSFVSVIAADEVLPDQRRLNLDQAIIGPIHDNDRLFQSIGIDRVSTVGTFSAKGDVLTDFDNAICSTGGRLSIVAPNGPVDDPQEDNTGFSFTMCRKVTQFGFVVADQSNLDMNITFHLVADGAIRSSYDFTSVGIPGPQLYFETNQPVEEINVLAEKGGGWCLKEVVLAGYEYAGGDPCGEAPSSSPSTTSPPTTETAFPTTSPTMAPSISPTGSPTPEPTNSPTEMGPVSIISRGDILPDQQELDFEHAPVGPISTTDSLFRNKGLQEVSLVGTFLRDDDTLSGSQNALCSAGGGILSIVAPQRPMDSIWAHDSGFLFKFVRKVTQFGFTILDQSNLPVSLIVRSTSGGTDVQSYNYTSVGLRVSHYFQIKEPAEEIQVLSSINGGWCLDNIVMAGFEVSQAPTTISPSASPYPTTTTQTPSLSPSVSPVQPLRLIKNEDLLPDQTLLDFDLASVGPIDEDDTFFQSRGVFEASLLGTFNNGGDRRDGNGNALCSTGGGSLSIVAPGTTIDNPAGLEDSGFSFYMCQNVTQFGFVIANESPIELTLSFKLVQNGKVLATHSYWSAGFLFHFPIYFQTSEPVEEIQVVAHRAGGWCLGSVWFAGFESGGSRCVIPSNSPSVSSSPSKPPSQTTPAPSLAPVQPVTVITRQDLLQDQQLLDFNLASPGPIDGRSPLFHDVGVEEVNLHGSFRAGSDRLGSGSNALCSTGGNLNIVAPNGRMDDPIADDTGFSFRMCQKVTQFGFVIVDQSLVDMVISFLLVSNGEVLSRYIYRSVGFPVSQPIYFQTSEPVEEIKVLGERGGGWCIDNVVFAGYEYGGILCDEPSMSPSVSSSPTTETAYPTLSPTTAPSLSPTTSPTLAPTGSPSISSPPSDLPTDAPTNTIQVISRGDLLPDLKELMFNSKPIGPINGDEFRPILREVALFGTFLSQGDRLNHGSNALCSTGNGILSIVNPGGVMDGTATTRTGSGFSFKPCQNVTQFGFVIADQNGVGISVIFRLVSNGEELGRYTYLSQGVPSAPIYFQTAEPVEEIQVAASRSGGWCLDNVVFAGFSGEDTCQEPTISPTVAPSISPTLSPSASPVECKLCFLPSPLTWPMSQYLAQSVNCSLASIESEGERSRVALELKRHLLVDRFWTGGAKSTTGERPENSDTDQWVWADGSGFSGELWAPNQPDGASDHVSEEEAEYIAVARDKTGNSALFDEAGSTTLPSIWECCSGCPDL